MTVAAHAAARNRARTEPILGAPALPDEPLSPASFRARGVVLPMTTSAFAFARLRDGVGGRELVMRNPSGGRGALVLALAKAADYARPTLHDRAVLADLAQVPRLDPAQVSGAARAAARAGLAGRSALAAAEHEAAAENHAVRAALAQLLLDLLGMEPDQLSSVAENPRAFAHAQAPTLDAAALRLGVARAELLAGLTRLGPMAAEAAQLAEALQRLSLFAADATDAAALDSGASSGAIGFTATAAAATAELATRVIGSVLDTFAAAEGAVLRHIAHPSWPGATLATARWMLDGWPALLARWAEAEGRGGQAETRAWAVIAAAAPPLPREAASTDPAHAAAGMAAVRSTWRHMALQGGPTRHGDDQALLERLRVTVP